MAITKLNPAIQFYASPSEFAGWLLEWVDRFALNALFARLYFRDEPPKFEVCRTVPWNELAAVTQLVRDYSHLYLSVGSLNAEVDNINKLAMVNRDQLHINLPQLTLRGLTAISLGSVVEANDSLSVYLAVARDVVKKTEQGVWFSVEGKKGEKLDRRFRYGSGAVALFEQGIPFTGGGRVVVDRFGGNTR